MKRDSPQKNRNKAQSFEDLTLDVCNFHIDSYQICKNWFKARNGSPLDNKDTQHYQRMVTVLKEMIKLAEEIKTVFHCAQLKKLLIFEKVRTVVTHKLGIEPDKITPMANFNTDIRADSLDTVELFMALEEVFEIEIPAQTAQTLVTVQQVADYISQKVQIAVQYQEMEADKIQWSHH